MSNATSNNLAATYPDDLWDIQHIPVGTVLRDWEEDGFRVMLVRGAASICAYIGVPNGSVLDGYYYDDLNVDCHGGLTFSDKGHGCWPETHYWYGYDHAHAGDYMIFRGAEQDVMKQVEGEVLRDIQKVNPEYLGHSATDKKWTIKDVVAGTWNPLFDFKRIRTLAEKIAAKAKL